MRQKKAKKMHYWILIGLQPRSEKGYSWCKGTADKSSVDE